MAISAGVAYVDILPNMGKFAPALAAQTSGASGVLTKFAKTGALALGAIGAGSVVMAADFEKSMRNVNSIANLSEGEFDALNEKVLALAGPTAQAPKTLADGLYDLVSSGFDANESIVILEASARAASAGLTTTEVATKSVAAVLNAYRLPASKAGLVSDQLFRTVDRGALSFEELASSIGDTLPFASTLGVGLEEVGAATATMTKQGLSAPETMTRIRNVLQTLLKPGTELKNTFEDLGYESGEALIEAEGFQGALEALVGSTDGSKTAIAALFPNVRALGGALALTGKNSADAREDLEGLRDSAGATTQVMNEQAKSLAFQWQRLKANLSVLAINIGNVLIPAISDAVRWLNEDFGPAFSKVAAEVKRIAGPLFGSLKQAIVALAPAFNVAKTAATILFRIFILNAKLGAAAIRVVANVVRVLGGVISSVIGGAVNLIRGAFVGAWNAVRGAAQAVASVIRGAVTGAVSALRAAFSVLGPVAASAFAVIKGAAAGVKAVIDGILGAVQGLINALQTALNLVSSLASGIKNVQSVPQPSGKRSTGGPVDPRRSYIVGERGREIFQPSTSGKIIPNHRIGATALAGAGGMGRFVIDNWKEGTGHFVDVAEGVVDNRRAFEGQRARMR
jgi:TP901 family phage tail tape measure protein